MKSVVVFLLMYFALETIPQATAPNGSFDITSLVTHIQCLEQSLSHLKSEVKSQEQIDAAVLSSALSKLTITTEELSNVKSDLDTLKTDHKATKVELETVKAELKSTQEELKLSADSVERNISACVLELERIRDAPNASEITFTALRVDVEGLTSKVNVSESSVALLKSDVTSLGTEVEEVERDLNSSQVVSETTQRKLEALSVKHEDTKTAVKKLQHEISICQGQRNGNHVTFQAHLSVTAKVSSTLTFDRVDFNTGDSYNATTGMFIAPVNGTYLFWSNVVFYADLGAHYIYLYQGQKVLARGYTILHHERETIDIGLASVMIVVHLDRQDMVHFATDQTPSTVTGYGRSLFFRINEPGPLHATKYMFSNKTISEWEIFFIRPHFYNNLLS